jgi:hypothetical protein
VVLKRASDEFRVRARWVDFKIATPISNSPSRRPAILKHTAPLVYCDLRPVAYAVPRTRVMSKQARHADKMLRKSNPSVDFFLRGQGTQLLRDNYLVYAMEVPGRNPVHIDVIPYNNSLQLLGLVDGKPPQPPLRETNPVTVICHSIVSNRIWRSVLSVSLQCQVKHTHAPALVPMPVGRIIILCLVLVLVVISRLS